MRDRLAGLLLFLPVPLVLWLFTAAPLGTSASLAAGVVIMLTHRVYARPFAVRRAARRCLWCGGRATSPTPVSVSDPLGPADWSACSNPHRDRALRTIAAAERGGFWLKTGILGGLIVFLCLAVLSATDRAGGLTHADAAALFKLAVALTVLPFSLVAPRAALPEESPRAPFPLHIQALVGTFAVLWLFRLVGLVWLVQVVRYAVGRGG